MDAKMKMGADDINWGILGTARIARKRMIKAIQQSNGNICFAIASRDINKAKQISEEFNIPRYYSSYEDLINDDEINAVYIPLPNSLHYSWVIQTAEKGKHILCEKPLGYSCSQVKEMIQTCRRNNVVLLEAHSYFLHPQYQKLFQLIENEKIGEVTQIQICFSFPAKKEHAIRFQSELGGGSLLDIGCYGIDLIHRIYDQEICDKDVLFKMENRVDMEFLGILKFNRSEAVIRASFFQDRQQTVLFQGKKGSIFLPDAFIPSGDKAFLFIKTDKESLIEETENADQYALLIQEFRKKVIGKDNLDSHHKRYIKNTQLLEEILKLRERVIIWNG